LTFDKFNDEIGISKNLKTNLVESYKFKDELEYLLTKQMNILN